MSWKQVVETLESAMEIAGQIDPGIKATTDEIAALTGVVGKVVGTIADQSGAPIEDVVDGLTFENPIV